MSTVSSGPYTLGTLMQGAVDDLRRAGCENPRLDARLLLCAATGFEASRIMAWPEQEVDPDTGAKFLAMIERRKLREPVSRILGSRDFWRHSFLISPDTLDPRPDSETLVEWAIDILANVPAPRIIDFGTGTGCLLLSILDDIANSSGIGVDLSPGAVEIATRNAAALGLSDQSRFVVSNWDRDLTAKDISDGFDAVISNPPYIAMDEMTGLDAEVRDHDPHLALTDGADGLTAYRKLSTVSFSLLRSGGFAIFEIGRGQEDAVADMLCQAGYQNVECRKDLGGIVRCVGGRKP